MGWGYDIVGFDGRQSSANSTLGGACPVFGNEELLPNIESGSFSLYCGFRLVIRTEEVQGYKFIDISLFAGEHSCSWLAEVRYIAKSGSPATKPMNEGYKSCSFAKHLKARVGSTKKWFINTISMRFS